MYLPLFDTHIPIRRGGRNTKESPEGSCPTVRSYYWHKFDLEYHWAIDRTRLRKCRQVRYLRIRREGGYLLVSCHEKMFRPRRSKHIREASGQTKHYDRQTQLTAGSGGRVCEALTPARNACESLSRSPCW